MNSELQASFDKCCRLCAEEQDVTIMLFSAEAEAMLLHNKLNQYLLIEVEEDDKLPKNVCLKCCTQLQTVCDFIDAARNAQEILLNRSLMIEDNMIDNMLSTNCGNNTHNFEEILVEPRCSSDDENKSTELEVNVDPMLVLQNSDTEFSPASEELSNSSNFSVEDVTHLHDVDSENVTIKLIKKTVSNDSSDKDGDDTNDNGNKNNDKPFPCIICYRSFFTELALKNHSWLHCADGRDVKLYKCSTCGEGYDFKNDLIHHLKTHKTSGICQFCGRSFRTEKNLTAHISVHLSSRKSFTCKICGRSYNTMSNLRAHNITHSTDRPYICNICHKSFKRNQDLKFHINQHTGERPYKCPFCDKCFASSGNCYSHRSRMHPGRKVEPIIEHHSTTIQENLAVVTKIPNEVPLVNVKGIVKYQCTVCNHSFRRKDNYTYHMYQHTRDKPYKCIYCTEKYVSKRGLLIHHEKEHASKPAPKF
ncbi:hypothetical protein ACJJTC_008044 [Scirpophaga incertulas]